MYTGVLWLIFDGHSLSENEFRFSLVICHIWTAHIVNNIKHVLFSNLLLILVILKQAGLYNVSLRRR